MINKRTIKQNIIGTVMCIFFICTSLLILLNLQRLNSIQVYNISSELFCMIVLFVMYMWHLRNKSINSKNEIVFSRLCIIIYFALIIDLATWLIDGFAKWRTFNSLLNAGMYILSYLHGATYIEYVFTYLDDENESKGKILRVLRVVIYITFTLRIIIMASGLYFFVDEQGLYHTGKMYFLSFFTMPVLSVFICGTAAGAGVSYRRLLAFFSYPIAILAMAGISVLNINYANSLVVITLSLIFIYCSIFLDEEEKKENLSESFQTYLSDDVVSHISDGSDVPEPGGRTVNVSMLFCLLHRFSDVVDTMEPEDVVLLLNHFYGEMSDVIDKHNGTLVEFPGYGIFCLFGVHDSTKNHASSAIDTAWEMKEKLIDINRWNTENHLPEISIGFGINTGNAVLGNIGSSTHMRYSAISSNVNIASRIETYSENGDIIISETTLKMSDNLDKYEIVDTIIPKGVTEAINIYVVREIKGEQGER